MPLLKDEPAAQKGPAPKRDNAEVARLQREYDDAMQRRKSFPETFQGSRSAFNSGLQRTGREVSRLGNELRLAKGDHPLQRAGLGQR